MATLTAPELQLIRNRCAESVPVNYAKAAVNAAAQAIEDFLVANAGTVSTAINTATSPVTLTAAQKKKLVAEVLYAKWVRDE